LALAQANRRAVALAEIYGMDPEAARLYHVIYNGALSDMATAFGLPQLDALTVLQIPMEREVIIGKRIE